MDRKIARLATRSHGVVTRRELLDAGISPEAIRRRLHAGALMAVHRGVYRVGHRAPSLEARYLAAVRACGPWAMLSGRAAAHLWGLIKGTPPDPEVRAPTERHVRGVTTVLSRRLPRRLPRNHTTSYRGIPITTVARTLVELAAVLPFDPLLRACHEAGVRYDTTPRQVEAVLVRRPNTPGARKLRRALEGDAHVTLSRLERRFLSLLRRHDLRLPEPNRPAGARRVDCRWPELRLTVELDSYRHHRSRHAWEQDRHREREAYARGDRFRRYTYGDVAEDPAALLRELRDLILDDSIL